LFSPNNFPNGKKLMINIQSTQQLGQALRSARKQLGLTQSELALAAGVGVRFIVDLEAGKPTVRLETVMRVIEALGGQIMLDGLPSVTGDEMP
jgi:HTH-type transcriptional regulator/antitoxin HipB